METKIVEGRVFRKSLIESWSKLSFVEQMGNIGSEVGRARKWQGKDENRFYLAVEKALELFDLTFRDNRWLGKIFHAVCFACQFAPIDGLDPPRKRAKREKWDKWE